jgi:hypothetical protein
MRLNGSLHIAWGAGMPYQVTYTPLGQSRAERPSRTFADRRALEQFLAGPAGLGHREITGACHALFRNGGYTIHEVWLTEEQMAEYALGSLWGRTPAFGGLAFHPATAA